MSDIGTQATDRKDAGTNTDLYKQFFNLNLEPKKKPHNIQINNKAKQPVVHPSIKHSAKQSYRRYKTKTEPKLFSKIMINEDDDIINKIKDAFGLQAGKPNKNFLEVQTAPAGSLIDNISQPPTLAPQFTSVYGISNIQNLTPEKIDNMRFDDVMKVMKRIYREGKEEDRAIFEETFKEKGEWEYIDEDAQKELIREATKRIVNRRQTAAERRTEAKLQEIDDISPEDQAELTGRANLRQATSLLLAEKPDEDYHYDDKTISEEEEVSVAKARPSMSHQQSARRITKFIRNVADKKLLKQSLSDIQSQASTLAPDRSLFEVLNMPRGRGRPKTAENIRKEYSAALLQQKKINKDKPPFQMPNLKFDVTNLDKSYNLYSDYNYAPKGKK